MPQRPWPSALGVLVALNLYGALAGTARAGGGAATDAYEGVGDASWLDAHAMADLYAQHDLNQPPSGQVQLRAFDGHQGVRINLLHAMLAHRPGPVGFRLDVGVGDLPDAYLAGDPGAHAYPDLSRALSYAEQAFVTVVAPIGEGLSVDVGKFGTPIGLEDNETLPNWNYSRSLLFTLAEPSYHSGLRATYPLSPDLAVSLFWLNGWDSNVLGGNGMRSLAAAVSWSPSPDVDLVADYSAGPEHAPRRLQDPTLGFRQELDAYAVVAVRRWLSLAATVDYGVDTAQGGVCWWGIGGYLRGQLLPWLAAVGRAEHLSDPQSFLAATGQGVAEATLTLEAATVVGPVRWVARLEVRRDRSDGEVFQAAGGRALTGQDTTTLGLIAAF